MHQISRTRILATAMVFLLGSLVLPTSLVAGEGEGPAVDSGRQSAAGGQGNLPLRRLRGGRPNVLLITIDTLRRDHLGAYGYALPTSTTIDRFAREGVRFTDVITPVPTTAPALAALLTGEHVEKHGVHENVGTFAVGLPSLAEAFSDAGYATAGFYGNEAVEGFGRGFETFEEFPEVIGSRGRVTSDRRGTTRALAWLEKAREPWFLWLHFLDPHGPYDSPASEPSAVLAHRTGAQNELILEQSEKNWVFGAIPRYQVMPGAKTVSDYIRGYDGEIMGTDGEIERLRSWLEGRGELDETLVVLTADHGESLGEDNYYFQHGKVLNEASLRVPLIFRHQAFPAGRTVAGPVSLVDLYPTLATLLGLEVPRAVAGRDVSATLFSGRAAPRTRVAYTVTPDLKVSIFREPWRLRGKPRKQDGMVRVDEFQNLALFDTRVTPERRVRPSEHPRVFAQMLTELKKVSLRTRSRPRDPATLTPEQTERLRNLGYID